MQNTRKNLSKKLGTWDIMVAGIALVVAASTLVSDFNGFFSIGIAFAIALLIGFGINLLLGLSAADLSVAYPRAGALYDYAYKIFGGTKGQVLGMFLGLSFYGMFAFTAAGETTAGAFGLKALIGWEAPTYLYIIIMTVLAVIPNVLGIKTAALFSTLLLIFMIAIRWGFGIIGFFNDSWELENMAMENITWTGPNGVLSAGLALAFWSFVGIEFAASLAEEVKDPEKSMTKGIVLGLLVILATSLVMGMGVTGVMPLNEWQNLTQSQSGCNGDCPQMVVGTTLGGTAGYYFMALASFSATLGSLTIAFAAMPRILFSIARDKMFFGKVFTPLGQIHPKTGTPVIAIIVTAFIYLIPSFYNQVVVDWIFSAAYVWILLYLVYHVLAVLNHKLHPERPKAFKSKWFIPIAISGFITTILGLYFAFAGAHFFYGSRALLVLLGASLITGLSYAITKWSALVKLIPTGQTTK